MSIDVARVIAIFRQLLADALFRLDYRGTVALLLA